MSNESPAESPGRDTWMIRDHVCDRFEAAWREGTGPAWRNFSPNHMDVIPANCSTTS